MVNLVLHDSSVGGHDVGGFSVKVPVGNTVNINQYFSCSASVNLHLSRGGK